MSVREKARDLTVEALYQFSLRGRSDLETIEKFAWANPKLYQAIIDLAREWLLEVVNEVEELDRLIDQRLENWLPERVGILERAILRLGTLHLLRHQEVDLEVVIDESVRLAKRYCDADAYKFVNGVLDALGKSLRRKGAS